MTEELPPFREWSIAAVRLLKGAVEFDDPATWQLVLGARSTLQEYFARIGLRLVVDETDGVAYLRQLEEDELAEGYERLPKLMHAAPLSYGATLLCVLLRDSLRRYEEEDLRNAQCVITDEELHEEWVAFFPPTSDEKKQRRYYDRAVKAIRDAGFVKPLEADGMDGPSWLVSRALRQRLRAEELETLRDRLSEFAEVQDEASQSTGSGEERA